MPHPLWEPYGPALSTNIDGSIAAQRLLAATITAGASIAGIPQLAQITLSSFKNVPTGLYAVPPASAINNIPGVSIPDFRSRKGYGPQSIQIRLDGLSAATRGSVKAGIISGLSASPIGAYSAFNLNGAGQSGYGWGDHDNPHALRNDYTAESHVATKWKEHPPAAGELATGDWKSTTNPLSVVTSFRGDKVNVIDFGKRTLVNVYEWNKRTKLPGRLGLNGAKLFGTQDFIKFYFTGPKLYNGAINDPEDDIIVFRASINSLSDTFSPTWSGQTMIGRADQNQHYTGYARDLQLDFTVFATDRDEVKPIWRKLNALAGYTAPTYVKSSISMQAPWLRITIGDLFVQQAVIITSLGYTLHDSDTTWEINHEADPQMMQTPHKISVSLGLTPIMDALPQQNGQFYTLAKRFGTDGAAIPGSDNWLSDFISTYKWTAKEQSEWASKNIGNIGTEIVKQDPKTGPTPIIGVGPLTQEVIP